jgi:hypothetical protein
MSGPTHTPMRDSSRDGSRAGRACLVCAGPLPSSRARYCSAACRQRAFRLRQPARAPVSLEQLTRRVRQQRALRAHTVYACPVCQTRLLGQRRCPECNRFCRSLGLGGTCPDCDTIIPLTDLLSLEVLL